MERAKRKFPAGFKTQILSGIASGGTISDLAKEHDLTVMMICLPKQQARDGDIYVAVEAAMRSVVRSESVDPRYVRELERKLRNANEKLGEMYIVVEDQKKSKGTFKICEMLDDSSVQRAFQLNQRKRDVIGISPLTH